MRLLITGGHLTPAIAVIDKILTEKQRYTKINISFVGRKHALDSEKTISFEFKEIHMRNVEFINLEAGKITRLLNLRSFQGIVKIPLGFINAFKILMRVHPGCILSFGGYLALPIVIVGWLMGIPVYTHEQTISPGLSNRIISYFSRKIFYSFERTAHLFPKNKAIYSGNPVRSSIFKVTTKPFELDNTLPTVYITGGSLGSHSINAHVLRILDELTENFNVIHQIGDVKEYNDFEECIKKRNVLTPLKRGRYFPVKHISTSDMGFVYSVADLVVGRAGANTFFELIHLKKPAILIPLPWSANQEQQKQAELFKSYGLGEVFEQKNKSGMLLTLIALVYKDKLKYLNHFHRLPIVMKQDAANCIIHEITKNY